MNISSLALSTSLFVGLSSVSADTLALAQQEVSGTIDLESDADGNAKDNGVYLRIGAGVNLAMDGHIKDFSETQGGVFESYTNQVISFDAGFEFNVALGIPLTGQWSIELMTGVAMNGVDSYSENVFVSDARRSFSGFTTYDDGDLYQVPIVANLRHEFDLNEALGLGVYAGVGVQYSNLSVSGGELVVPGISPLAPEDGSGNAWAFRYQIGVDLSWDIAANTTLGMNLRYSGTSESAFNNDFKVESLSNLAIGATFSLTF
jgi:opacity protein-like surface antigen